MEEPIWQKRVPKKMPDWLQTATVAFPSGRTAEELVANDEAHLAWAVNLGVIDFNPWPARRADLDRAGRAARRPRPRRRGRLGRRPPDRAGRPRRAGGARAARLPEDVGLEGDPRQRPDRARVGLARRAPRSARAGARGRAARARPRDEQVVEGGAPRRVRRLQPERPRPDRGVVLLRPPDPGRAGVVRARVGRGRRRRARRPADRHRARPATDDAATPRRTSTASRARSTSCSSSRGATRRRGWATRRGRRTSPSRRASPSACSRAATATARATAGAPATRSRAGRRRASTWAASQRGFGSKPRTGQGHAEEFDD